MDTDVPKAFSDGLFQAETDGNNCRIVPFPNAQPISDRGRDVERVNQYPLYELGKALRAISAYTGDVPAAAPFWDLYGSISAIDNLLEGKPFPIGISRGAAQSLKTEIQTIYFNHFWADKADGSGKEFSFPSQGDPPIQGHRWDAVRAALSRFETIFAAEIGEATTYFVPRRGIYSTPALVDSADDAFPETLRGYIPEKTKDDWRAAGRCLAFLLLSASGFHVARAVEGTLEAYYQLFTGKPDATRRSWDDYFKELTKIAAGNPTPCPEQRTLAELDQMRQDYRNPLMHPRVTLDEAEARILFNNGESLIIGMASEICKARSAQSGVQPALALVAPIAES